MQGWFWACLDFNVPVVVTGGAMKLKYYFPVSVAAFLLMVGAVYLLSLPVLPFAMIILFGETLLGFQVEDHKVRHWAEDLWRAIRH
jgi:hypothetical protein